MPRTIRVETTLDATAERVWAAMKHPASFLYVCRGLFGWPALTGRTDPIQEGEAGSGWLFLFHVVPVHRHAIEVLEVNEKERTIRSHEHGGILRRWDHTLQVQPGGPEQCQHSDMVEIDAGPLTGVVAVAAHWIYRYRQRRWHRLVAKHLNPAGPAYRLVAYPDSWPTVLTCRNTRM